VSPLIVIRKGKKIKIGNAGKSEVRTTEPQKKKKKKIENKEKRKGRTTRPKKKKKKKKRSYGPDSVNIRVKLFDPTKNFWRKGF